MAFQIHLPSLLQMQRAGKKPLSIIYFKINANEILSRQWPSFTIKSDLFRKDLRCRFPANGGAATVTPQLGMQFVMGRGALTWFALISGGRERRPGRGRGLGSCRAAAALGCPATSGRGTRRRHGLGCCCLCRKVTAKPWPQRCDGDSSALGSVVPGLPDSRAGRANERCA